MTFHRCVTLDAKRQQTDSLKVQTDLCQGSYRPRMALPAVTRFQLGMFTFGPPHAVTLHGVCKATMQARPELVGFSTWPLFCPHYKSNGVTITVNACRVTVLTACLTGAEPAASTSRVSGRQRRQARQWTLQVPLWLHPCSNLFCPGTLLPKTLCSLYLFFKPMSFWNSSDETRFNGTLVWFLLWPRRTEGGLCVSSGS